MRKMTRFVLPCYSTYFTSKNRSFCHRRKKSNQPRVTLSKMFYTAARASWAIQTMRSLPVSKKEVGSERRQVEVLDYGWTTTSLWTCSPELPLELQVRISLVLFWVSHTKLIIYIHRRQCDETQKTGRRRLSLQDR